VRGTAARGIANQARLGPCARLHGHSGCASGAGGHLDIGSGSCAAGAAAAEFTGRRIGVCQVRISLIRTNLERVAQGLHTLCEDPTRGARGSGSRMCSADQAALAPLLAEVNKPDRQAKVLHLAGAAA